jgi:hypothetical protein
MASSREPDGSRAVGRSIGHAAAGCQEPVQIGLYGLRPKTAQHGITSDRIAAIRAEYLAAGGARTNARYGYVAGTTA